MVDEAKKEKDFLGVPKDDLTLGLAGTALLIAVGLGIKTLTDMQRTGQLPQFFPNPQLMAQQQQEMINAQIAAQAQADAAAQEEAPEIEEDETAAPNPMQVAQDEGIRTVPRRGGVFERINI
jgi:hypothetical protein